MPDNSNLIYDESGYLIGTTRPVFGRKRQGIPYPRAPAAANTLDLAAAADVALDLQSIARQLAQAAWDLDSALSARRKALAGYRSPDPSTGRIVEHEDIPDAEIRAKLNVASVLLRNAKAAGF